MSATEAFDPPVCMDGVAYSQVALPRRGAIEAPIADEWRLYVVRGDGLMLCAEDAGGCTGALAWGTVIGMAGDRAHRFVAAAEGAPPAGAERAAAAARWREVPLGSAADPGEAIVAIGRIARSSIPFVSFFGSFVIVDPDAEPELASRIGVMIDLIGAEIRRADGSTNAIVRRLAEIVTIEIGRVAQSQTVVLRDRPGDAGYDPRIWRTVAAICRAPQQPWTVARMAAIAGMSRSAFAARYRETVGTTPLKSLRRLRMQRSATTLAAGAQPLSRLADAMGYGSEAAFCRAFAKEFGAPPQRYGRTARPAPEQDAPPRPD